MVHFLQKKQDFPGIRGTYHPCIHCSSPHLMTPGTPASFLIYHFLPELERKPRQDPSCPWNFRRVSSGRGVGELCASSANGKSLRPPEVTEHPGPQLQSKAHLQEAAWGHPHTQDTAYFHSTGSWWGIKKGRVGVREPQTEGREVVKVRVRQNRVQILPPPLSLLREATVSHRNSFPHL